MPTARPIASCWIHSYSAPGVSAATRRIASSRSTGSSLVRLRRSLPSRMN